MAVERDATRLRRLLREQGLSRRCIDAAWPGGLSDGELDTDEGRAKLRQALSSRLGLSSDELTGNRVVFVWRDEARYKHLRSETPDELAALTSFGMAVGRYLLSAVSAPGQLPRLDAGAIRRAILEIDPWVNLGSLIEIAWGLGIPIAHLRVFPLETKSMQAMVVTHEGRHAILLGRDASYPAPLAFTVAHELGHIARGHLAGVPALVDLADESELRDEQEQEADHFALKLLSGRQVPVIAADREPSNGRALAQAAMSGGRHYGVEPGTLALIAGHQWGRFDVANEALAHIYDRPRPMWEAVNAITWRKLSTERLTADAAEFLGRVLAPPA